MIARLIIKFKKHENLNYSINLGSVMQGVLMEQISWEYADEMHVSEIHPYSQYVSLKNGQLNWIICTLNDDSQNNIINPVLSDFFSSVKINNRNVELTIESKSLYTISYNDLFQKKYMSDKSYRYIDLEFITPTAFKSCGKYVIFPTSRLIFNNLIKKYDLSSDSTQIYDETLADEIVQHTDIVEYNLRSVKYSIEKTTIPSFMGYVTLKINGTPEFIRLMNMLLEFGEFSGTGIKTSMGMGAYRITGKRGAIQ